MERVVGWKAINPPQGCVNNFELGQRWKVSIVSSSVDMAAGRHFQSDASLLKVDHGKRRQVLSGSVHETFFQHLQR